MRLQLTCPSECLSHQLAHTGHRNLELKHERVRLSMSHCSMTCSIICIAKLNQWSRAARVTWSLCGVASQDRGSCHYLYRQNHDYKAELTP